MWISLFFSLLLVAGGNGALSSSHWKTDRRFELSKMTVKISANASIFNVVDFGANGDGKTDNTRPFQSALNAAGNNQGGTVLIPAGNFFFIGSLTVPKAVALEGTYKSVPSHAPGQNPSDTPTDGTVLMPTGGKGNESGTPFISLTEDSFLRGVTIYYPRQPGDRLPSPYPWSISMSGNNAAVTDVECLNCFNAVRAVSAARHYIARIQGQPINTGIFVDQTYDIGRIEDVHWNPWYSNKKEFMAWQVLNGRAFVFARTDWEYVFNTFAFGYAIGYHFTASKDGSCNGNFLGIGADMATNASVQVDAADAFGILITNGEFTAFADPKFGQSAADPTQVVVTATNKGSVRFVNSAFWGPSNSIAKISGSGTTGFGDCTLCQWDQSKKGRSAIEIDGATGNLMVNNCDFQHDGNQIDLGSSPTLARAVITGNVFQGATRVTGKARNTQMGLNADGNPH
eukprot:m.26768 g.26768  ORF g.26768 m.26768 type:complete len:456 (+) comp29501_c0_seq3:37-1404(+)